MRFILVVAAVTCFFAASAFSKDGSSGCGLGWQVTKKKSLVSSSIRATTNVIASNTFAMTTGTSGCAKHDIVKNEKEELHYAEANYERLEIEMAQGDGEHLRAFAALLGCSNNAFGAFSDMARSKHDQLFGPANHDADSMLENVKNQIQTDAMLATGCMRG